MWKPTNTMLFYNIEDYNEFQEIFGMRDCGNGNKSRRNKILLALWKDKNLFRKHVQRKLGDDSVVIDWLSFKDTNVILSWVWRCVRSIDWEMDGRLNLNENSYSSPDYKTDEYGGLCVDGSANAIRYVRLDNGKTYKMKASKMARHIIDTCKLTCDLPEQIKIQFCEDFAEKWRTYAEQKIGKAYELHVDDTEEAFHGIYGGNRIRESFGSCMHNSEQYYFYHDAVDAKAAWLTDGAGYMVARCVIFTNVANETTNGKVRLAERQYSQGGDNVLKRILVDKLIEAGEIDGYKAVGVDCHNAQAYVSNDGESWSDVGFHIPCHLRCGDTLSYQDSFKWYVEDEDIAYNYECDDYTAQLDETSSTYHGNGEYCPTRDEYYDRDALVWCEWRDEFIHEDDAICIHGEWYYAGYDCECPEDYGLHQCPNCGEWLREDSCNSCYSELTDEWYCCEDCLNEGEDEYKQDNWTYVEYDDVYEEDENEVTSIFEWSGRTKTYDNITILCDTLAELIDKGEAVEYEGDYYLGGLFTDDYGDLVPSVAATLQSAI